MTDDSDDKWRGGKTTEKASRKTEALSWKWEAPVRGKGFCFQDQQYQDGSGLPRSRWNHDFTESNHEKGNDKAADSEEWIKEHDTPLVAWKDRNWRRIKDVGRSAHLLAMYEREKLGMDLIQQVIKVQEDLVRGLKGGIGFEHAMQCKLWFTNLQ
ncbi:MAG: hypothetical protein M1831_004436 [Alyxoria varia]|nr:MAG: hypothetical protein M1831_004436 [Alyxoria varia]